LLKPFVSKIWSPIDKINQVAVNYQQEALL